MHRSGFKGAIREWLVTVSVAAAVLAASAALVPASAADEKAGPPDLMAGGMGWDSAGGLMPVPGSPSPVTQDPNREYVPNNTGRQPTWRYADVNNPNLTEFARAGLRKANEMVDKGFAMYNRTSRCWMPGVVSLNLSPGRTYFIQTPKVVYIIWERDQIVRRVYMDQAHSEEPKVSWQGESVGHYEGDTLVVDTIGETTKTFVDLFRTPHSDKLRVVERFRIIEDGKALEVEMTVEDPASFVQPWKGTKRWEKVPIQFSEIRCMDGESVNPLNQEYAEILEPLPVAERPDF